jgi:TolB-like protein
MTTPSQDDFSPPSAKGEAARLAEGLPDHLRFVVIVLLLVGGPALAAGVDDSRWAWVSFLVALALFVHLVVTRRTDDAEASRTLEPRPGEPLTVGVLSFAERGASGREEARGDGFAAELIDRLNRVRDLNVKPPHAMLRFKGTRTPTWKVARALGANYLINGTVWKEGGQYRVEAEIVQAWDRGRWREAWERPVGEWLELQSDVAEAVAERLMEVRRGRDREVLSREERFELRERPVEDEDANLNFMDGRAAVQRFNRMRNPRDFHVAEERFRESLKLDAEYADARTMLGFLYLLAWETAGTRELLQRSEAEFRKALERNPEEPMAAAELGYHALVSGRTEEAVRLVEAAAERHPHETIPRNVRALLYMYLGFYESAVHLTRDIYRDDPDYVYPPTNASTCCYLMEDGKNALWWAELPEGKAPGAFIVPLVEGAAWFLKGEMASADRAWRRGLKVAPPELQSLFRVTRAWIHADRGDRYGPAAVVRDHRNDPWLDGPYGPYFISLCSLAGEHDLALEVLERQVAWGASYRYLLGDRTLRPLRNHPGFQQLLRVRYERWLEVRELVENAPKRPPPLPSPDEVVTMQPGLAG